MFEFPDFSKIGPSIEALSTAMQQIRNAVMLQNRLTALLIMQNYRGLTPDEAKWVNDHADTISLLTWPVGEPVGETPQDAP